MSVEPLRMAGEWQHLCPSSVEGLVMLGWIGPQVPWWVTGPGVGLCVVALYGLLRGWVERRQRQPLSTEPTVSASVAGHGVTA